MERTPRPPSAAELEERWTGRPQRKPRVAPPPHLNLGRKGPLDTLSDGEDSPLAPDSTPSKRRKTAGQQASTPAHRPTARRARTRKISPRTAQQNTTTRTSPRATRPKTRSQTARAPAGSQTARPQTPGPRPSSLKTPTARKTSSEKKPTTTKSVQITDPEDALRPRGGLKGPLAGKISVGEMDKMMVIGEQSGASKRKISAGELDLALGQGKKAKRDDRTQTPRRVYFKVPDSWRMPTHNDFANVRVVLGIQYRGLRLDEEGDVEAYDGDQYESKFFRDFLDKEGVAESDFPSRIFLRLCSFKDADAFAVIRIVTGLMRVTKKVGLTFVNLIRYDAEQLIGAFCKSRSNWEAVFTAYMKGIAPGRLQKPAYMRVYRANYDPWEIIPKQRRLGEDQEIDEAYYYGGITQWLAQMHGRRILNQTDGEGMITVEVTSVGMWCGLSALGEWMARRYASTLRQKGLTCGLITMFAMLQEEVANFWGETDRRDTQTDNTSWFTADQLSLVAARMGRELGIGPVQILLEKPDCPGYRKGNHRCLSLLDYPNMHEAPGDILWLVLFEKHYSIKLTEVGEEKTGDVWTGSSSGQIRNIHRVDRLLREEGVTLSTFDATGLEKLENLSDNDIRELLGRLAASGRTPKRKLDPIPKPQSEMSTAPENPPQEPAAKSTPAKKNPNKTTTSTTETTAAKTPSAKLSVAEEKAKPAQDDILSLPTWYGGQEQDQRLDPRMMETTKSLHNPRVWTRINIRGEIFKVPVEVWAAKEIHMKNFPDEITAYIHELVKARVPLTIPDPIRTETFLVLDLVNHRIPYSHQQPYRDVWEKLKKGEKPNLVMLLAAACLVRDRPKLWATLITLLERQEMANLVDPRVLLHITGTGEIVNVNTGDVVSQSLVRPDLAKRRFVKDTSRKTDDKTFIETWKKAELNVGRSGPEENLHPKSKPLMFFYNNLYVRDAETLLAEKRRRPATRLYRTAQSKNLAETIGACTDADDCEGDVIAEDEDATLLKDLAVDDQMEGIVPADDGTVGIQGVRSSLKVLTRTNSWVASRLGVIRAPRSRQEIYQKNMATLLDYNRVEWEQALNCSQRKVVNKILRPIVTSAMVDMYGQSMSDRLSTLVEEVFTKYSRKFVQLLEDPDNRREGDDDQNEPEDDGLEDGEDAPEDNDLEGGDDQPESGSEPRSGGKQIPEGSDPGQTNQGRAAGGEDTPPENHVATALLRGRALAKRENWSAQPPPGPVGPPQPRPVGTKPKKRPNFLRSLIAEEEYVEPENFLGQDLYADVSGLQQLSQGGFESFMNREPSEPELFTDELARSLDENLASDADNQSRGKGKFTLEDDGAASEGREDYDEVGHVGCVEIPDAPESPLPPQPPRKRVPGVTEISDDEKTACEEDESMKNVEDGDGLNDEIAR